MREKGIKIEQNKAPEVEKAPNLVKPLKLKKLQIQIADVGG